jgi:serine/threonine protein kinase
VLISDDGRALIADHGASHATTATAMQNLQTRSSVNFTPRFMAPEIVTGYRVRPTKMADIWSFGCLCYHVFFSYSPYDYKDLRLTSFRSSHGKSHTTSIVIFKSLLSYSGKSFRRALAKQSSTIRKKSMSFGTTLTKNRIGTNSATNCGVWFWGVVHLNLGIGRQFQTSNSWLLTWR